GNFWAKGDSFPSEHAAAAWSVATVFAHEYPGPLTKLFAYGGAAAISAARVTADKHFASDALVGSAIGYFIGRQVYRAHHDQGLGDAAYGTFERARAAEGPRDPANMGSTYVALDSWVYTAMDRLAALGYINSAFAGMRPWTRMECARLLQEADSHIQSNVTSGAANVEAVRLSQALRAEFLIESRRLNGDRNVSAELESIYTRFTGISGKPLNDSYHFGQTIINDYGRPYQEGFNMITGFTSHAEAGPLAFYVRGEYQHAPSAPAYPLSVRQAIATADANPVQAAIPIAARDNFQLLDTYVALNIKNNQISFGRQSTWWGPGQGGALMFSDNALPFYSLRWTQVSPFKLPSFLAFLGPMRTDMFLGRLEGHHFPGNPYITAQKVSFKPTENLELGFSKISIFAGGGHPLAWYNFYKSTFSVNDTPTSVAYYKFDVGDRRGGFDFTYRIPGLRKWLTLYSDSLVDDDPSPLAAPRRAAINPGIYLSHVPSLPKLDFRAEAVNT
ncbi:MAG: capsule assembly Wzi family protein, partial [Terriglobales bacterium]